MGEKPLEPKSAAAIESWIIDYLRESLGLHSVALGPQTRLFAIGLDSVEAVGMAEALAAWLGTKIAPTIAWDQPTIAALASYLAGEAQAEPPLAASAGDAERPKDLEKSAEHPFAAHINPHLSRLLSQLSLDKRFVRGLGCKLYDDEGREYLDFIAAYGALPFGHNPPEIWQALHAVHAQSEPNLIQPSYMNAAGELAARLLSICPPGMRYVSFANSGAEAVEAAIKMCRLATGRPGILSTQHGFHGKTLGALSATGNTRYHGVGSPVLHFDSIPYGDAAALRTALASRPGHYAAFLVEPIQGEGGIVMPPPGYLSEVRAACTAANVLLVFDEIQSGLGRTGAWFACNHEGVVPDVMTLAKALSGGLIPIGAVVAAAHAYSPEFARKHSSTFAGGSLACRAGLATLDYLSRNQGALIRQVAENGQRFKAGLERLAARCPHLISEVRGRGYFLGLRFAVHRRTWPSSILGVAADAGGLAPIFASYLLNVEGVRLAPTLNGTDVIRIEPPLIATWAECETVLSAIERALDVFASGDAARVLGGILARAPWSGRQPHPDREDALIIPQPRADGGRFAFLLHPLELSSYADFDRSLSAMPPSELKAAVRCVHGLATPAVVGDAHIESATGQTAYGEFIMLGHTAAELVAMSHDEAVEVIGEAVEMARDRGAQIVGLGAFTSIVTHGGLSVSHSDVAVTSGNSYTAVAAHDALMLALAQRSVADATIAVVGAAGAIGRAVSILLSESAARLILVGNPHRSAASTRARLLDVVAAACQHVVLQAAANSDRPRGRLAQHILSAAGVPRAGAPVAAYGELAKQLTLSGSTDFFVLGQDASAAVQSADAILTATSATGALFTAADFVPGAVICDISRPRNIGPELRAARPDLLVIDGGVIAIPGQPDIGGFGLPKGHAYACMAETMILALEKRYAHMSLGGELSLGSIDLLRTLGQKHGFRVVTSSADRSVDSSPQPRRRSVHGQVQHLSQPSAVSAAPSGLLGNLNRP